MGYRGSLMFHGSSAEATSNIVAVRDDRPHQWAFCFAALCSQALHLVTAGESVVQEWTA